MTNNTVFAVTYTRRYGTIDGYRYEKEFKLFSTKEKAQAFVENEIIDPDIHGYQRPYIAKEGGKGEIKKVEVA